MSHSLFEDFCFHRFLAQQPLRFTDLLERIAQLGGRHHTFTGTAPRQAAVLIQLAPQEQLAGLDPVAPNHHRNALPWLKTLANHSQFLLWAPAAPSLLTQKSPTLIAAVNNKHYHLRIPYRQGRYDVSVFYEARSCKMPTCRV